MDVEDIAQRTGQRKDKPLKHNGSFSKASREMAVKLQHILAVFKQTQQEISLKSPYDQNIIHDMQDVIQQLNEQTALLQKKNIENEHLQLRIEQLEQLLVNPQAAAVTGDRLKLSLDKLTLLVNEKEKRIVELQQFELSFKKAVDQKFQLEAALKTQELQQHQSHLEKEGLHNALIESRQHAEQLERAVQFLQEKSDEINLELNQGQCQLQDIKNQNMTLNKELSEVKQNNAFMAQQLAVGQDEHATMSKELELLYQQLENLKCRFKEQQATLEKVNQSLNQSNVINEQQAVEKQRTETLLEHKTAALHSLEHEVAIIKQHLIKGLRDAKEIESRYFEAVHEKIATLTKFNQLKAETDRWFGEKEEAKKGLRAATQRESENARIHSAQLNQAKELTLHLQNELEQAEHDKGAMGLRLSEMQSSLENLCQQLEITQESKHNLEQTCQNLAHSNKEKDLEIITYADKLLVLEQNFAQQHSELESARAVSLENELQLAEARQHMAKKMREISEMREICDELQGQIADLTTACEAANALSHTLQEQSEQHLEEEQQWQLTMESAQAEIKNWEEKYLKLDLQRQAAENKVKELDRLEGRHMQLKNILANLGSVLGSSFIPAEEEREQPQMHPEESVSASEDFLLPPQSPYGNLFDMPKTKEPPKGTLFDEV